MSPKLFLVLFLGVVPLTATFSLARSSAQTTTEDEPETTLMMGGGGKKGPSKSGPKLPSNYKPPTFSVHDQELKAMADDGTYEDPEKAEKPEETAKKLSEKPEKPSEKPTNKPSDMPSKETKKPNYPEMPKKPSNAN